MSAVTRAMADYDYERRVLMSELRDWGRWQEKHADFEGHSSINILAAYTGGAGGGSPGHRILCLEMPTKIYCTHQRVIRLPEPEQDAIQIKFVTVLAPDGTIRTIEERCRTVGVSLDAFRKRLSRAYQRIMGINPL